MAALLFLIWKHNFTAENAILKTCAEESFYYYKISKLQELPILDYSLKIELANSL